MSKGEIHSDEALMRMAQEGRRDAFKVLYQRYSRQAFHYFLRMLRRDKELAEDYTQELFIKVIKNTEKFDQSRVFKTWFFSIAHNMCKNNYRHEEVKSRAAHELQMRVVKSPAQPDKEIDRSGIKDEIDKALAALDEPKRHCFILRFKFELSIKEIAEIEGVSEGTVKSRLFYTLKELSKTLKAFNPKMSQHV